VNFFHERKLSQAASDLIQFDADSIRQVAAGQHDAPPDVWLADPDAYEKNGRVLRDSDSPRMLAYSTTSSVLYATDGCNSCARRVGQAFAAMSLPELQEFAKQNEIRTEFLKELVALVQSASRHGV
jgi:hypothetical protein